MIVLAKSLHKALQLISPSNILEKSILFSADSYMFKAMQEVYAEIRQIKGSGAPKKRVDEFERRVTRVSGIWIKVHDGIEAEFDALFAKYELALVKRVGEIFDSLHMKFNLLCDESVPKDDEEKAMEEVLREKLQESLVKAKAMVEAGGVIPSLVEQCKNYSTAQAQHNNNGLFVSQ